MVLPLSLPRVCQGNQIEPRLHFDFVLFINLHFFDVGILTSSLCLTLSPSSPLAFSFLPHAIPKFSLNPKSIGSNLNISIWFDLQSAGFQASRYHSLIIVFALVDNCCQVILLGMKQLGLQN